MKRYLFLFILFFLISYKGLAQQFFACTSLGQLELVTMTSNGPISVAVPGCGTNNYFSIAILNNKIYYIAFHGTLYSADIVNGNSPSIINCTPLFNNIYATGLTIDTQGVLYIADGNQLYSFDPKNPILNFLGSMPYSAAGDLAFFDNQLYMTAKEGIIKVTLNDPSKSSVYISTPGSDFYGLTTIMLNGNYIMYAFNDLGFSTTMLELDMKNRLVKGEVGTLPFSDYDNGSSVETGVVHKTTISKLKVTQECGAFNEAQLNVACLPDTNQYTFTLNLGRRNTTGTFNGLAPGNYNLSIISSGDQVVKDTAFTIPDFTVNNPVITATIINPACNTMGQIKMDAGAADSAYKIQFGNDTFGFDHTFGGLSPGDYHFFILNKKGCISDEKDYTLKYLCPPILISNFQMKQECDTLNKAQVVLTCNPNTHNTFTLNTGQSDTTGVFDNLSPGNYELTITSTDGFLTKDSSFTVPDFTVNNPVITATITNQGCSAMGQIKLDAGAADSTYNVKFGNDTFGFDHTFTGLSAGNYHFVILNKKGCISDEKDYTLKYFCPLLISSFQMKQECDTFNKAQVIVTCNTNTHNTFVLNTGQSDTTGVFDNLSPGNYQLIITSGVTFLTKDTSFVIPDFTVNNPVITAELKDPICDKPGEIKLDAGIADATYTIKYNSNNFTFDHIFTGLTAGNYHFTILNNKGCITDEKDFTLLQDACPPIVIDAVQVQEECDFFDQANVTVTTKQHPDNYIFTLNNISDTTGIFDYIKPGTYNLIITSSGGDTLKQPIIVPDYALNAPAVTYTVKNVECEIPGQIKFAINGDSKGAVTIKQGTELYTIEQTIKNLSPGINNFSLLNQQGCVIDTISVNIQQVDCHPVVFPNAFSPNNDGINDVFKPLPGSNPINFKILIYNRWGALLFQSGSIDNGWDGKYNSKPAPVGVYYWIAKYTMTDNKKGIQSGYVTLIR